MRYAIVCTLLLVAACGPDFTPRDKVATVDEQTGEVIPPYPCPDWSQSSVVNYDNSLHSNYGCAVNNNLAVQLVDPKDLVRGRAGPLNNPTMDARTITRYNAGEIPTALTPIQTGSGSE